jgi:glycosyltransferase involved in cell wall biosynthesis
MGSLLEKKRVDKIIEYFHKFSAEKKNCLLRIAGIGPELPRLKRKVEKLGVASRTKFDGKFEEVDKGEILKSFDVYVSLHNEGLSVIEAMAAGRCVVVGTNRRPETELIVHGINGVVIDESYADPLEWLEELYSSPKIANTYGYNAQRTIGKNATVNEMAQSIEKSVDYALSN